MKRNLFLPWFGWTCLVFCHGNLRADPLNNWSWCNPLPNGNLPPSQSFFYGISFGDGQFVRVGQNGVASISTNGTNWFSWATATTNQLNGVAYINNLFVAVGTNGTIETSGDGIHWLLENSGTTASLNAVAGGDGQFLAVGSSGVAVYSTDGIHWSLDNTGTSQGLTGLAYGPAGFVAIGFPANLVFYSADGVNWTNFSLSLGYLGFDTTYLSIVSYFNGQFLVGGYCNGQTHVETSFLSSTDGQTWVTNESTVFDTETFGLSYDCFLVRSNTLMAVGTAGLSSFIQSSPDGFQWTLNDDEPLPNENTYCENFSGETGNGVSVIVAALATGPPYNTSPCTFFSTDGINWETNQAGNTPPTGPTNGFTSVAFGNGIFVAAGGGSLGLSTNGSAYATVTNSPDLSSVIAYTNGFVGVGASGVVYQSTNGLYWTQRTSATDNNLHTITAGNGLLVAVGDAGAIQTSPGGTIWTSRNSGTSLTLFGVTYANNLFVAVGQSGTVLTSPDGINWSGQFSGLLTNFLSITYGSAGFLAVGLGGTIITSPDGTNWMTQSSGTQASLESASFGNGYYLVTGTGAVAMTSPDGVNWTSRNVGAAGGQTLAGSAFFNNAFVIVGSGGTILDSAVVPPLFDVQFLAGSQQNSLTVFATPGMSFRLQSCTNLAAGTWSDLATFNNAAAISYWTNSATTAPHVFYRAISP